MKKVERKSGRSDVMVSKRFLSERMEDYSVESYITVTSNYTETLIIIDRRLSNRESCLKTMFFGE